MRSEESGEEGEGGTLTARLAVAQYPLCWISKNIFFLFVFALANVTVADEAACGVLVLDEMAGALYVI